MAQLLLTRANFRLWHKADVQRPILLCDGDGDGWQDRRGAVAVGAAAGGQIWGRCRHHPASTRAWSDAPARRCPILYADTDVGTTFSVSESFRWLWLTWLEPGAALRSPARPVTSGAHRLTKASKVSAEGRLLKASCFLRTPILDVDRQHGSNLT
jgi:hypothetical protein